MPFRRAKARFPPNAKSSRHSKKSNVSRTKESENETLDAFVQPGVVKLETSLNSVFVTFVYFVVSLCQSLVLYFGTASLKTAKQWHVFSYNPGFLENYFTVLPVKSRKKTRVKTELNCDQVGFAVLASRFYALSHTSREMP